MTKFDPEQYYNQVNTKLKNRTFQDVDEKTQRKLNEQVLKNWRRKVNNVDMAYADALALGGYEFFMDYISGKLDPEFATSVLKALRKREAIMQAKLIKAIITTSSVAARGDSKAKSSIRQIDETLNGEAYGD